MLKSSSHKDNNQYLNTNDYQDHIYISSLIKRISMVKILRLFIKFVIISYFLGMLWYILVLYIGQKINDDENFINFSDFNM